MLSELRASFISLVHLFTISVGPAGERCVYNGVFIMVCLQWCVYNGVFIMVCLQWCVYNGVFTMVCL